MVFNPDEYYQGIEAVAVDAYTYAPLRLAAANVEVDQSNDQAAMIQNVFATVPDVTFSYYLNPSNALVDVTDLKKFNFIVANKNYTRALENDDITINKVVRENGAIKVTGSVVNAEQIHSIQNEDKVTVTALTYSDGDTTIVSDFAAIRPQQIDNFVINNCAAGEDVHAHLFKKAKQAVAAPATYTVAYDESIDLKALVNVHYDVNGNDDLLFPAEKMAEKGFKLNFELIGYISGDNNTNETKHAKLENGVLTPQGINGKTAASSIGRHPLVRITLVDTNNNNIAAVAYAKVDITEKSATPVDGGSYSKNIDYTLKCSTSSFINNEKWLTWADVEQNILDKVDLSRAQFDNRYRLDAVSGVAKQFVKNEAGSYVLADETFGEVKSTESDALAHQTDVLTWTIRNNEAYEHVLANGGEPKTITVRFVPKHTVDAQLPPVYVTLAWTSKDPKINPTVKFEDKDKVASVWFKENSTDNGYDELHAHVMEAKSGNFDEFDFNVAQSTFKDADGNIVPPMSLLQERLWDSFEDLANQAVFSFEFVTPKYAKAGSAKYGANHYTLSVKTEYLEGGLVAHNSGLYATANGVTKRIAYIVPQTGKVVYEHNDFSEDVLNYASHHSLNNGETLTARVAMKAKTCEPATDAIKVEGNEFNVKFLRPINIRKTKVDPVVDADPSKHVQKVEFVFEDWRDMDNADVKRSSNNTTTLYRFYDVQSIQQDHSRQVTSNFANGGDNFTPLYSRDFVVEYQGVNSIDGVNWGEVTYVKNTTVAVHTFQVKIPVIVTYGWGKIYTEFTVTVKPTVANAAPRK